MVGALFAGCLGCVRGCWVVIFGLGAVVPSLCFGFSAWRVWCFVVLGGWLVFCGGFVCFPVVLVWVDSALGLFLCGVFGGISIGLLLFGFWLCICVGLVVCAVVGWVVDCLGTF